MHLLYNYISIKHSTSRISGNLMSVSIERCGNALNVESEHDAAEYVQKVLGNDFTVPPKEAVATAAYNRREHSFG